MVELPDDAIEAAKVAVICAARAAYLPLDAAAAVAVAAAEPVIAARVRAEALPRCERTADHLRHDFPVTVHCDGIGAQVCNPARYQHLGPWETVKPWQDVRRCTACGTEIGK